MKDGQLFRVKVIKDESDLPKEQDRYFCHDRSYSNDFIMTLWFELTQHSKFDWLQNVDWYLIPEPEIAEKSDVSDADIEAWAEGKEHWKTNYKLGLIDGARAVLNGEIKKIEK